jgi:hypothetical protein
MHYENHYTFRGFLNTFLDAIDGSYCSTISPLDPPYPDPADGGYKGSLQCGVYDPPKVISISYGSAEADLPISYQRRQCAEFMKLGTMGVSVLVASGDSGVSGRGGDPTPSNCLGTNGRVFAPDFPATCPYLTAVGGTEIPTGSSPEDHQEQAVTRFPSGGGFSNITRHLNIRLRLLLVTLTRPSPHTHTMRAWTTAASGRIAVSTTGSDVPIQMLLPWVIRSSSITGEWPCRLVGHRPPHLYSPQSSPESTRSDWPLASPLSGLSTLYCTHTLRHSLTWSRAATRVATLMASLRRKVGIQ